MAKRRVSFVHEWFDLVDKSGLVMSEPVLHVHFPGGPEPVDRRAARALLGSWERFLVDRLDAARRGRWTEAVLFDLLGWPRERFCGHREVPEDLWFRPDEVEEEGVYRAAVYAVGVPALRRGAESPAARQCAAAPLPDCSPPQGVAAAFERHGAGLGRGA